MTYHTQALCDRALALVEATPRRRVAEVARDLGVDRHTLERALKARGLSFRLAQREITLRLAMQWLAGEVPCSAKTVANRLGFSSTGALAHFLRRHTGSGPRELRRDRPYLRQNVLLTDEESA